jgi:hypothetical protein
MPTVLAATRAKNARQSRIVGCRNSDHDEGCAAVDARALMRWSTRSVRCPHTSAASTRPGTAPISAAGTSPTALSRKNIAGPPAQPSEPPSPWMLKARPSRLESTEALRIAKSAGWNTELPSPPSTAIAANWANECATAMEPIAQPSASRPPARIGRAPKRSTAKPAAVWPKPDTA